MRTLVASALLVGGIAHAAPKARPTVTFETPAVTGAIEAKTVVTVVKKSSSRLLACYTKALAKSPDLQGTATAIFSIDGNGKVAAAVASGVADDVDACVTAVLQKLTFAKPTDGKTVDVTYSIYFTAGNRITGTFPTTTGSGIGIGNDTAYGGLIGNTLDEDNRGYGVGQRVGPGGGGVGDGTIGTGRYGTIGGGGSGRVPRRSAVPMAQVGQPVVQGDLDKAIIRRYIRRATQKLQYCYEKELLAKPGIKGTVTADFTIGNDGLVSASTAKGMGNTNVESCVAGVVKAIEFPKPKGTGTVAVSVPLTYVPAEPTPAKK
jgi:outer membrane biosynthesis protein TonB